MTKMMMAGVQESPRCAKRFFFFPFWCAATEYEDEWSRAKGDMQGGSMIV
jgi:hypothetical protein